MPRAAAHQCGIAFLGSHLNSSARNEFCSRIAERELQRPPAQVAEYRRSLGIRVSGFDVPKPIKLFAHCGFDAPLAAAVAKAGYERPTAIQAQALPAALSGRDVLVRCNSGRVGAIDVVVQGGVGGGWCAAAASQQAQQEVQLMLAQPSSPQPHTRRALPRRGLARRRRLCCPWWCTSWTSRSWARGRGPSQWWWPPRENWRSRYTRRPVSAGPGGRGGLAGVVAGRGLPTAGSRLSIAAIDCLRGAPRCALTEAQPCGAPVGLPTPSATCAGRFGKPYNLSISAAFGGLSKSTQFKELKAGAEVSCS